MDFSSVAAFKMPTKNKFSFKKFFLLITLRRLHLHQSSKIISHKEVIKQYKSRFFLLFYLMMDGSGSRSGSVQIMTDPDPGGPKNYGFGFITLSLSLVSI